MVIDPKMLAYLEQNNDPALQDWINEHFIWHQLLYLTAKTKGFPSFSTYPILQDMSDLEGWLYFHNLEHQNIAASLRVGQPPDLTDVDPQDQINWDSWLEVHAEIHDDLRSALGIT